MNGLLEKCAVIVLNWNGIEDTIACIASLEQQSIGTPIIWIIDNASTGQDVEELCRLYEHKPHIKLIKNQQNIGFGKAHNLVFEELYRRGYEWVACINNDAVADQYWLEELLKCTGLKNAFSIGSLMLQHKNPTMVDSAGHCMLNTAETIPLGHNEPQETLKPINGVNGVISNCAGACLYNVHIMQRIGVFDHHFFVGYEDAELGLRAWLLGYENYINTDARVLHKMSASIKTIRNAEYLAQIQHYIFYTWFKLMPTSIILTHLPFQFFKYAAVVIIDILFLRFSFLKIILWGIKKTITQGEKIATSRRHFYRNNSVERTYSEINAMLTFFLETDVRRFFTQVLKVKSPRLVK
jgi:GT2 family glycosyltransferase